MSRNILRHGWRVGDHGEQDWEHLTELLAVANDVECVQSESADTAWRNARDVVFNLGGAVD